MVDRGSLRIRRSCDDAMVFLVLAMYRTHADSSSKECTGKIVGDNTWARL